MINDEQELRDRVRELEDQVKTLEGSARNMGVRRESELTVLGMPLWAIAIGPDVKSGEVRGHARGFIAIGDIATGVIALGGLARGGIAFGGLAVGLITLAVVPSACCWG